MADRYVYSGGSNTSPYDTWAKAATTLATAISGASAGDTFYVADDHSESTASAVTLTLPGQSSFPDRVLCVLRSGGSVPPVAADLRTTAIIATTGANGITIQGAAYIYGIIFNVGTGASAANLLMQEVAESRAYLKFSACSFNLVTTSTSSVIRPTTNNSRTEWNNCTVSFGNVSQTIQPAGGGGGWWLWTNKPGSTAITGATIPTNLLNFFGSQAGATLVGLDLSALGSGKTIAATSYRMVALTNCKLHASVTVTATPSHPAREGLRLIGCDSGGAVARNEIYVWGGTLTTNTTVKRTAGASDGTTAYSWKIVTDGNVVGLYPVKTFEGAIWNSATGSSKTLTIHTVTDNVTLTDAEIWVEVEYLGSSATPVSTLITDANATVLTTAANQATSTEAWTTTGLATPVKQKLDVTFTPQMAGPIRWRVCVAKANTTVYVCPKAEIS